MALLQEGPASSRQGEERTYARGAPRGREKARLKDAAANKDYVLKIEAELMDALVWHYDLEAWAAVHPHKEIQPCELPNEPESIEEIQE